MADHGHLGVLVTGVTGDLECMSGRGNPQDAAEDRGDTTESIDADRHPFRPRRDTTVMAKKFTLVLATLAAVLGLAVPAHAEETTSTTTAVCTIFEPCVHWPK